MLSLFGITVGVLAWKTYRHVTGKPALSLDQRGARTWTGAIVLVLLLPSVIGLATVAECLLAAEAHIPISEVLYAGLWSDVMYTDPQQIPLHMQAMLAGIGPSLLLLLAGTLTLWTRKRPGRAADALLRLELSRMLLWTALIIYPFGSLVTKSGQFHELRTLSAEAMTYGGTAFLFAYGIAAAMLMTIWRGPWQQEYRWLTSPLRDRYADIRHRLREEPDWVEGLQDLGRIYLQRAQSAPAVQVLSRAFELSPDRAETLFLLGMAQLQAGKAATASQHLRTAGLALETPLGDGPHRQLLFDTTLGLAAARLQMGDVPGAVLTAREATRQKPADPRAALIMADSLLAAGRLIEAETVLEQALESSEGGFHVEILSRLTTLHSG